MLARLQQITTLGALLLAALWAVLCWRSGQTAWGLVGVLFILGGYALVLGLEFMLLGLAHGADPTPRATVRQLLAAWWGEVKSAPLVFCWRQPFRSGQWPDHLPAEGQGRRGVLLVHGFFCNRGVWNTWLNRLGAAGTPVVAVNLEPVFGSIDDYRTQIDEAVRSLERCTGLAPVIVAHSMGGLAVRRWWQEPGNLDRVHHLVTIGSPHHGTWLARFAMTRNLRQMRQLSDWLRTLAASESSDSRQAITCFYSHCDNIVFPPRTAALPGAANHHLEGVAHVHMVERPEPWAELQLRLDRPAVARPHVGRV